MAARRVLRHSEDFSGFRCSPCRGDDTFQKDREVFVNLQDIRFSAAHFVAFKGFREPLHGHNYTVGLRAGGPVQADGYVADFGEFKKVGRAACEALDQKTLIPASSDALTVASTNGQCEVVCEGGARLSFPEQDCALIPVVHTTAEELSEFLWWDILVNRKLNALLLSRKVAWFEVTVSERPGQGSSYRCEVSRSMAPRATLQRSGIVPRPCFGEESLNAVFADEPRSGAHREDSMYSVAGPINSDKDVFQMSRAEAAYKVLLEALGQDSVCAEVWQRTPHRAAKAFGEMTRGMRIEDPLSVIGNGIFDVPEARDLVVIRDMPFHSMCEHHLLPFSGIAHIAYIPQGKVLGLSKFPRLLEVFARRLQLQERLSAQYADACMAALQPRALAVAMEATHACMCHRGVGVNASTRTLVLKGPGKDDPDVKEQLLEGVSFGGLRRARL